MITVFRNSVSPFMTGEFGLVDAFAAQAVIAITNVLQYRDAKARLEQEQAASEVLDVILDRLVKSVLCSTRSCPTPRDCAARPRRR